MNVEEAWTDLLVSIRRGHIQRAKAAAKVIEECLDEHGPPPTVVSVPGLHDVNVHLARSLCEYVRGLK